MSNTMTKLTFLSQDGADYLIWKNRNNPDSPFHQASAGVYIGTRYCNDFLTRRWFYNTKQVITDPSNFLFFGAVGAVTSKADNPRGVAGDVLLHIMLAFLVYMLFAIPILVLFMLWDLLVMIPFMLIVRNQTQRLIEEKVKQSGGNSADLVVIEREIDNLSQSLMAELEFAASK